MMAALMPKGNESRKRLLWFAFILSIVTYIDRVCISTAAPAIRQELGLSTVQVGWMFSVFTFAYAFFAGESRRRMGRASNGGSFSMPIFSSYASCIFAWLIHSISISRGCPFT